ncbi:MAG: hypothetical protein JSV00_03750 [bacterium]|nr:MAG: hypothetical protein JSV00_03750 [bacterium]
MIPEDCLELLEGLNSAGVRYLLGGDAALNFYGVGRAVGILELVTDPAAGVPSGFLEVLGRKGWVPAGHDGTADPLTVGGDVPTWAFRSGQESGIPVKAAPSGDMAFDPAFSRRLEVRCDRLTIPVLSLVDLIAVKRASPGQRDNADAGILERILRMRGG